MSTLTLNLVVLGGAVVAPPLALLVALRVRRWRETRKLVSRRFAEIGR